MSSEESYWEFCINCWSKTNTHLDNVVFGFSLFGVQVWALLLSGYYTIGDYLKSLGLNFNYIMCLLMPTFLGLL